MLEEFHCKSATEILNFYEIGSAECKVQGSIPLLPKLGPFVLLHIRLVF